VRYRIAGGGAGRVCRAARSTLCVARPPEQEATSPIEIHTPTVGGDERDRGRRDGTRAVDKPVESRGVRPNLLWVVDEASDKQSQETAKLARGSCLPTNSVVATDAVAVLGSGSRIKTLKCRAAAAPGRKPINPPATIRSSPKV
jgi:hypothetical protein